MKKTYTVVWFYEANYERVEVMSSSPEEAMKTITFLFGKQFWDAATVMVFEGKPILEHLALNPLKR